MDCESTIQLALAHAGIGSSRVTRFASPTPTAQMTAAALDTDVANIVNSLVFNADRAPLLVLASGQHRVSTRRLSTDLGVARLRRATPEFVLEHTGQEVGGVGPIGHPRPIRTVVDLALADLGRVWVGAGTHDSVFATDFHELVALTRGIPLKVAE